VQLEWEPVMNNDPGWMEKEKFPSEGSPVTCQIQIKNIYVFGVYIQTKKLRNTSRFKMMPIFKPVIKKTTAEHSFSIIDTRLRQFSFNDTPVEWL
jgi:hypothetical protein